MGELTANLPLPFNEWSDYLKEVTGQTQLSRSQIEAVSHFVISGAVHDFLAERAEQRIAMQEVPNA